MNRENKRKQFQNGYYKTTAVTTPLPASTAGGSWCPSGRAHSTATIAPTALSACIWTMNPATAPPTAADRGKDRLMGGEGRLRVNVCGAARLHGRVRAPRLAKRHHKP